MQDILKDSSFPVMRRKLFKELVVQQSRKPNCRAQRESWRLLIYQVWTLEDGVHKLTVLP
jgi:hypothetical protein